VTKFIANITIIFKTCFRKALFDLVVEKEVLVHSLETVEEAISSFLHLCFVADMKYPPGSGVLCTYIQRWIARLDEFGTMAKSRKDLAVPEDKAKRAFVKAFNDYKDKVFMLTRGGRE